MSARSRTSSWRISLLGGVAITDPSGHDVDPGPAKCRELLAALALEPQVAVPVSRLVVLLWGDDPPRTAEKTLQTYVARLRKALGHDAIARVGAAYRLELPPESIDTSRFRRAIRDGDRTGALDEWGGEPLAGLDNDALRPLADALTEEWLAAVEADLADAVDADPGGAVPRLTELVSGNPFREALWALLMTALYRSGRQAEALDAYRRARTTLVEELGVEPGPQLRELEELVLRQDERLTRPPASPTASPSARPTLPTGTITFGSVVIADLDEVWAEQPSTAAELVAVVEAHIDRESAAHHGVVFGRGPEVMTVAFERAADAIEWSVRLHEAIEGEDWRDGAPMLRVALHTGEADERNGTYFGPTVTTAQRLAGLAHGGQTIVSASTAAIDDSRATSLGTFVVDGFAAELELHQVGSQRFPAPRLTRRPGDDLPPVRGRLIGRDDLVRRVRGSLESSRLVTLVGPGGIGKTRLAVEIARRSSPASADGVWFVNLAEIVESAEVARAVADALGVGESADGAILDGVVDRLRRRTALIVLDNCEHVIDGAADAAETIVGRCPAVSIIATSREGLGVADEQLVAVGPLSPDDAGVELFVARARAVDQDLDADRHADVIRAICRRLDGVPLAIELAAARVRSLAPDDLLERIEVSFRPLTGGRRSTVERHRTLRATMKWSHDLLEPDERLLFRRLAVFTGPFDLVAAERIVVDDDLPADDVNVLLGDLVDKSMCLVESAVTGTHYRLLEPIRHFALEALHDAEDDRPLRDRHAAHARREVERIGALLTSPDEIEGAAQLADLWPNLRSAFDWAVERRDVDLSRAFVRPIVAQGFTRRGLGEIRDWVERLMELAGRDDEETIADGLFWSALHYALNQDRADFQRLVDRFGEPDLPYARLARLIVDDDEFSIIDAAPAAIAEARRRGDRSVAQLFEVFSAGNLLTSGRLDEAEVHIADAVERVGDELPPTLRNWLNYIYATVLAIRGDVVRADALYDEIASMPLPPRTNSPNEGLEARRAFRSGDHRGAFAGLRDNIEELLDVNNLSGAGTIGIEFIHMMIAIERLDHAAMVLGYFESNGLLSVEGPGFRVLVEDALHDVAVDADASRLRAEWAERDMDPREVMSEMARVLHELLAR
ncbi:MAG: BTAD domain-containing putative transcriptional regulator [Actinomycetota bacterium]